MQREKASGASVSASLYIDVEVGKQMAPLVHERRRLRGLTVYAVLGSAS